MVDVLTVDPVAGFRTHWLCTMATLLNPVAMYHHILGQMRSATYNSADLYLEARQRHAAAHAVPIEIQNRAIAFFTCFFVLLLA
eukprot:4168641-Pyramimonas_sp.AAC.1